jgi:hypothetical protein
LRWISAQKFQTEVPWISLPCATWVAMKALVRSTSIFL